VTSGRALGWETGISCLYVISAMSYCRFVERSEDSVARNSEGAGSFVGRCERHHGKERSKMRKAALTHSSQRKCAPSSLADVEALLGLAGARCECCWRYHSLAGTGLRVGARRPSSVRKREYLHNPVQYL